MYVCVCVCECSYVGADQCLCLQLNSIHTSISRFPNILYMFVNLFFTNLESLQMAHCTEFMYHQIMPRLAITRVDDRRSSPTKASFVLWDVNSLIIGTKVCNERDTIISLKWNRDMVRKVTTIIGKFNLVRVETKILNYFKLQGQLEDLRFEEEAVA